MNNISNNKRIAKNILYLYFRTILVMLITLYTSRVLLNVLGVTDFGIYNVVGGVVIMFSFLNNAMAAGTQRFLSFELGRQNYVRLKKTFSMLLTIHIIIAIIILILAETIGLWLVNTKLNIPIERMESARWVYQFSILSFMITVTQVPYNASIIAHEKMNMFAYISIIDVLLKLFIVFVLTWINFNNLKLYSILMFIVIFIVAVIYRFYCKQKFEECSYHYDWDKKLFKTLISYSSWNLFGGISVVVSNQGLNILLNIFFGPTINAARSIAYQVNGAISSFTSNIYTAVNPQIVKSYANENNEYMISLIYKSAKYSFFLLFLISLPVLLETDFILNIWLKNAPNFSVVFCRLVLIESLINCLSHPLITAVQATGKIKWYQIIVGSLIISNLFFSYVILKIYQRPEIVFYISIVISTIALLVRLFILERFICISLSKYVKYVIIRTIPVTLISTSFTLFIMLKFDYGLVRFILASTSSVILTLLSVYFIGLQKTEKRLFKNKIISLYDNKIHNI